MQWLSTLALAGLLVSTGDAGVGDEALRPADGGRIPLSNVAGKKLIRGARETRHFSQDQLEVPLPV